MRIGVLLITAVVGVLWTSITVSRVAVWGDERALWVSAVQHAPTKPRVWVNVGRMHARHSHPVNAAAAYQHAIDLSAEQGRPEAERRHAAVFARINLALLLEAQGQHPLAVLYARHALAAAPNDLGIQGAAAWILRE